MLEGPGQLKLDVFQPLAPRLELLGGIGVTDELVKFTLLTRDVAIYLVDRYSERRESADGLSKRVNQRSI